ncbi:MAG: tyrosine-protein phosphatase [Dorea sp.]|nr:tyrosine-protein phosphatase [Dorea sp.]
MENLKRIPFEHLYNCRDLGGYACAGGTVAWHRLYRAEAPCNLTEAEWEKMKEMGVRTVIDLRSPMEQKSAPYETPEGVERISYPLQQYELNLDGEKEWNKEELIELAKQSFGESLSAGYVKMILDGPERVVHLLQVIADRLGKGAVCYHCSAGKDRTGVLSAVIYLLCGVSPMDIVADYQVSATYQGQNPLFSQIPEEFRSYMATPPETMEGFLVAAVQEDYIGFLRKNGLTEEVINLLKEQLIGNYAD